MGKNWKRLYDFVEKSISFTQTNTHKKQKWDWFNNNEWFKYMVWIMCNTAMRGGEVRILKWKKDNSELFSQIKTAKNEQNNNKLLITRLHIKEISYKPDTITFNRNHFRQVHT